MSSTFSKMAESPLPCSSASWTGVPAVRSAVVHWRFPSGPGADDYERYETVIDRGTCTTARDKSGSPRVTSFVAVASVWSTYIERNL